MEPMHLSPSGQWVPLDPTDYTQLRLGPGFSLLGRTYNAQV